MIKVDNSYKRRIFTADNSDEVLYLKIRVEEKINDAEKGDCTFNDLNIFDAERLKNKISIFTYKDKIDRAIRELIDEIDNDDFKEELRLLRTDIYKILVCDFPTMKDYLNNLADDTYLICREKKPEREEDFNKYKEKFGKLYKDNLSTPQDLKKSFFNLFEDVNVCPYCNRNFINPIHKEYSETLDNQNQSPDIEHFFPKSIYPFLALSISNLLPSCAFCNKIKSDYDTNENFKSPYEIEENDFKFKFDSLEVGKRTIKLDTSLKNSEVLHLESLYANVHSQYVNDIYLDVKKNPIANREYLNNFFALPLDTQEKIYKDKFCNYYKDSDFNKQALSKMTKDLFMQVQEDERNI